MLYFQLQQLHKSPFSNYNRSITFLNGLAGSEYTDQVITLLTTVKNYKLDESWTDVGESGLLPEHLRIPALATRLNQFAQRRMSNSMMPYANRLNFNDQYPEHHMQQPQAYRIGDTPHPHCSQQYHTDNNTSSGSNTNQNRSPYHS